MFASNYAWDLRCLGLTCFNCNSFANDAVGFLTGCAIPDFIEDLPADFLSTPFGAALRPTIDAMFRAPSASSTERLAHDAANNNNNASRKGGLAFTKIDIGVRLGSALAQEYSMCATPTFVFFLDGKKVAEIRGADAGELKTQSMAALVCPSVSLTIPPFTDCSSAAAAQLIRKWPMCLGIWGDNNGGTSGCV
ncbi:hypothetical protein EYR36_011834 [Pleurotus pulmonarius]|nr:hypothetical protein EYR36_011834 [Pleurotus pulmonarius]KAF4607280.1 hypothetical protein EYR38_001341 [Pleurotus pulmonarius]